MLVDHCGCPLLAVSNCPAGRRRGLVPFWVCGSVLIVTAIAPPAPAQQHEKDLTARLKEEIPDKWNEIIMPNVQRLHSTYTLTETNLLKKGEVSRKVRGEYKYAGLCFLYRFEHEIQPRDPPEASSLFSPNESFILGRNPRYEFWLVSPPGPPAWEIKMVSPRAALDPEWMAIGPYWARNNRNYLVHLSEATGHFLWLSLLFDVLTSPGMRDHQIQWAREEPNDLSLVRIHFEGMRSFIGWAILDSRACWCVREYEMVWGDQQWGQTRQHGKFEYRTLKNGFPILEKSVRRETRWEGKKIHDTKIVCEFSGELKSKIPEAEFTLEAFGLSESRPSGSPRASSGNSVWLWVLGAAGVWLVLALAIYWVSRRRGKKKNAVP